MTRGLEALAAHRSPAEGLRWLERAYRLAPLDPNAILTLASACLGTDPARAASLFGTVSDQFDVRQAWLGLAAARLRLSDSDGAADALAVVLSRFAFSDDTASLADAIAQAGWCAVRPDGRLEIRADDTVRVLLDGKPLRGTRLPAGWESRRTIDARIGAPLSGEVPLLGSPIQIAALRRLNGCVEAVDGGLRGWAWHPGDNETAPVLDLLDRSGRRVRRFVAHEETVIADLGPLARPRAFCLTRADLKGATGVVRIVGPDGKDLPGSPIDPFANEAANIATAIQLAREYPAGPAAKSWQIGNPVVGPIGADARKRAATVVIIVQADAAAALASVDSVLASLPPAGRILVVDDGTLDDRARQRRVTLLRHDRTLGAPAAANAAIRATQGRDIVLLSPGTLVPQGWLDRLRDAAYAERDHGSVTALSNLAGDLGYPDPAGLATKPDQTLTNRLDRAAQRANGGSVIDRPAGTTACLYLRRDCLNAVGAFRADLFGSGGGEDIDLCLRGRRLGWRNVVATGLFVGHAGETPHDNRLASLRERNRRIIDQMYPGAREPRDNAALTEARRRIDLQRWREPVRKQHRSAILITHDAGGGVEQRLMRASDMHRRDGRRPILLRPARTAAGEPAIAVRDGAADDLTNLVYAMPRELPALLRLLRATKPEMIEAHHFADYPPAVYELVTHLGVPYDVHIHDYAWFCPRVSLVGANDRYCGEPDLLDCEACVADLGHFLQEDIPVADLRRRSGAFLAAARRVVVPSDDTGLRMRRHFDGLTTITIPHEDDSAIPPAIRPNATPQTRASICVVGGIGIHKGYDILLACARDAVRRDLNLEFIVVGHTIDDARMLATGRVFVTGRFEPDEAVGLIAEQHAQLGFVTSICPETWCLSLGEIWRAGLRAAAFDIGAPAERIRNTGRGIILPLGLSASAINNALVAATWTAAH